MIPTDTHLQIGSLLYEGVDQIDLTGPFEVFSRIPNSTYRIYGLCGEPVRDIKGLRLAPDATIDEAPQLDVLHVPGGFGQEQLMNDERLLSWLRHQAAGTSACFRCARARYCSAPAGCSRGPAPPPTGPCSSLLPYFGATPQMSESSPTVASSSPPASPQGSTAP